MLTSANDRLTAFLDTAIASLESLTVALRQYRDGDGISAISSATTVQAVAGGSSPVDLSAHNSAWKKGVRLTKLGRRAIMHAYATGLDPEQVSTLFKITLGSAYTYQKRCNHQMPWPRGEEPEGFKPLRH